MFRVSVNTLAMIVSTRGLEFITARKISLRRLCFSTCLSVILFTGRGGFCIWGGSASREGSTSRQGPASSRGGSTSREGSAYPLPDTTGYGQRVGGRHPTGMHSCSSMGAIPGVTNTLQTDALFTHAQTFCLTKVPFHQSCKEVELLTCLPLHFKR